MVLLDCSSVGLVTDGVVIINYYDGTLLVIANGYNDKKDLLKTRVFLDQMKTNVIGIVMSKMSIRRSIIVIAIVVRRERDR